MGARCLPLARTLWRHGGVSRGNAAVVPLALLLGLIRFPNCAIEHARIARSPRTSFDPPPIFLVGHWRSGTTLLHNLLSQDPAFCFPRLHDVISPYEFFPSLLERYSLRILWRFLPVKRPMDDVPLRPELPQEEEVALAAMDGPSFLNCLYFPREMNRIFREEVLFEGESARRVKKWQRAYLYYLRKLSLRYPNRRLVLKNPANSARIPLLREMFPGAKFVHIHRDPYEVIASTSRLYQRMLDEVALQPYRREDLNEHVAWAYSRVMDVLLRDLEALPDSDRVEIGYSDLVDRPGDTLRLVYESLGLGFDGSHRRRIDAFMTATPVRPAPPVNLSDDLVQSILARCATLFPRLGYSPDRSARTAPAV